MTREEHIENLKAIASDMPSDKCSDWIESLMAGVKALEQEPCADMVSRESIIEIVNHQRFGMSKIAFGIITEKVKELPSVAPQPKMGRWIDDKCSVCGKGIEDLIDSPEWYRNEEPNFCPFCGIKMEMEV